MVADTVNFFYVFCQLINTSMTMQRYLFLKITLFKNIYYCYTCRQILKMNMEKTKNKEN